MTHAGPASSSRFFCQQQRILELPSEACGGNLGVGPGPESAVACCLLLAHHIIKGSDTSHAFSHAGSHSTTVV